MKNLIIALSLTLASSASFANGFIPWQDRGGLADTAGADSYRISVQSVGFAPWRDHTSRAAFGEEKGMAMDVIEHNIFRPWS